MRSFDARVVAITGAGSGIGRALAIDLAGRGSLLALSDVDPAGLGETVDLVKAAGVREVRSDVVDVASRTAVEAWASEVVGQFGRVNVLVNNAGVSLSGDFSDLDVDDMEWVVDINFWGVVHGTRAFLPHLIASGEGHVVTMSSLFGLLSIPGQSLYNATKYAVRGLSESLREEMLIAGHPVGVTVVHPGGVKTAIVRRGRSSWREDQAEVARMFDERLAKMAPERAAEIILRGGAARQAARPRRPRRARAAPVRAGRRRALPGRRGAPRSTDATAEVSLAPGDTVHVRMLKWGDRPHWQFDSVYLGDDEHGTWLGFPRGTQHDPARRRLRLPHRPARPGASRRTRPTRSAAGWRPSTAPAGRCRCTSTSRPRRPGPTRP